MDLTLPPVKAPNVTIIHQADRRILVRHPGYNQPHNTLLHLLASDPIPNSTPTRHGLYARFALDACGVVAGNRWEGWLSTGSLDTDTRIDPESILEPGDYYFHLPDNENNGLPYRIVPFFQTWRFPHRNLPSHWTQCCGSGALKPSWAKATLSEALHSRDSTCRITGCTEETQAAHLCPQEEPGWFRDNEMYRYNCADSTHMDDLSNAVLLRQDLHTAFDRPMFVFVPKPGSDSDTKQLKQHLVVHVVTVSPEYESLYHNRRLLSLRSSIHLYFARFAWALFPLLEIFLNHAVKRRLLLTAATDQSELDEDGFIDGDKAFEKYKKKRSGNQAMRPKRSAEEADSAGESPSDTTEDNETLPPKRRRYTTSSDNSDLSPSNSSSGSTMRGGPNSREHPDNEPTIAGSAANADISPKVIRHLAKAGLAKERSRLTDEQREAWEDEKRWAKKVSHGKITLSGGEAKKYYRAIGVEVFSDDDG